MISDVYRRPLLALNVLPALHFWSWSNTVAAPKPLAWKDSGRRLSIEELVGANFYITQQYAERGIEIRELDADVLKDIVQEAWLRVDGSWSDEPEDVYRTAAAWAVLEAHPDYSRDHGYRHPAARFSSVWLRHVAEQRSPSAGGS